MHMKFNRTTATVFAAIGTAAVVSAVTTTLLVSGGSHATPPPVNAHLAGASVSPSPSLSPTVTTSPARTVKKVQPATNPTGASNHLTTAPQTAGVASAPTDTPTPAPSDTPAPASPTADPHGPPPAGTAVGGSCPPGQENGTFYMGGSGTEYKCVNGVVTWNNWP
jgi:hypothetical protein